MATFLLAATGATIVFFLTVDIIKIFIEASWPKKYPEFNSDPTEFTVIITAFNEAEMIVRTIRLLKRNFPPENIILADDGSTDRTAEIAKAAEPAMKVLSLPHGKKAALEAALEEVKTPYVLLSDADVYSPENLRCPNSLLEDSTSCGIKILPRPSFDSGLTIKNLLIGLQHHEYKRAMYSRDFAKDHGGVYLISGAFGFFRTERIKYLTRYHTGLFPGDDLERTLIDLASGGKTNYLPQPAIETDVPQTIRHLIRQRVTNWWPGFWRCFPLLCRIVIQKKSSLVLRLEVLYELLGTVLDMPKIISLFYLIWHQHWLLLTELYLLYFLLELFSACQFDELKKLKHFWLVITLSPIYNVAQMFFRIAAMGVLLLKKMNPGWPSVKTLIPMSSLSLLLTILPSLGNSKDLSMTPGIEHVADSHGRKFTVPTLAIDYKNVWLDSQYGPYNNRFDLGIYSRFYGLTLMPRIRMRYREEFELTPKIAAEFPITKQLFRKRRKRLEHYHFNRTSYQFSLNVPLK